MPKIIGGTGTRLTLAHVKMEAVQSRRSLRPTATWTKPFTSPPNKGRKGRSTITSLRKRIVILVSVTAYLTTATQAADRKVVNNNIMISDRDPKIRIELPTSVWYVGVDRFVVHDTGECELYGFVQTDDEKNVQRLYWIQFQDYLASKPEVDREDDSDRHVTIGAFRFSVASWAKRTNENIAAGSDEDHLVALILAQGYKMPGGMVFLRLIHLSDEKKPKELMITYCEDIKRIGFAAADLKKGGKAESLWRTLEGDLLLRAWQEMKIEGTNTP
jgi:hypothetical protein